MHSMSSIPMQRRIPNDRQGGRILEQENPMIAIPNMEKPKNCFQCSFNDEIYCCLIDTDTDALIPKIPTERLPLCPLIEIVRCGECKWYNPWHANYTNIDGNYCRNINRPMKPTDFCSYGERRADEKTL